MSKICKTLNADFGDIVEYVLDAEIWDLYNENRVGMCSWFGCKGEDSLLGAIKETKEEVGIDLEPENGQVLLTKTRKNFNDIMDVWLFEYDGAVDLANAATDEVAQVAWMSREQIKELFEQKVFVDSWDTFLRKWIRSTRNR